MEQNVVLLILMDWALPHRKSRIQLHRELVKPSRLSCPISFYKMTGMIVLKRQKQLKTASDCDSIAFFKQWSFT